MAVFACVSGATGQLALQSWAQTGTANLTSGNTDFKRGEPVTLNFSNAEIDAVARAMATLTGRQVVVDPRVKGTMNLSTERAVSPTAAYNLFLATLRLQGFTVVEAAGLDKVVPEADAKLQSGTVSAGAASTSSNQIITQIFKLNFENANNLVPVLRPLISPNNTINVNPGNNSLVITDYADNLQRMARIIAAMDVSNATDVEVIKLQHAIASDLAPLVLRLIESGSSAVGAPGQGQTDTTFKTTLVAEPRSNSLILRAANPARIAQVKSLVEKLDTASTQSNGASGNIYVVYLKNADATKLAATLRAAMSGETRSSTPLAPSTTLNTPSAPMTPGWRSGSKSNHDRRANPGRPGHQLPHHHRARAAIPPVARSDRQTRRAARPGVCGEPDRRSQCRSGGAIWHPVANGTGQRRQQHRGRAGHQLWQRWQEHH